MTYLRSRCLQVACCVAIALTAVLACGCRSSRAGSDTLQVVLIHGTGAHSAPRGGPGAKAWWHPGSAFCDALRHEIGSDCRLVAFRWSGDNDHDARLAAGEQLARKLRRLRAAGFAGRIALVGHSHGGNVALGAVNRIERGTVKEVILLGTPQMSVRLPSRDMRNPIEEGGGEDATARHWLYWGRAAVRVGGTIWNLYSPEDMVQTVLAKWSSGPDAGTLIVDRKYGGIDRDRVPNGAVHWRPAADASLAERLPGRTGVRAHSAMHSERMGAVVGRLLSGCGSFDEAMEHAGLSSDSNDITDFGGRSGVSAPSAGSPITQYEAPEFDADSPPYRVNMAGPAGKSVGVLLVHGFTAAPTEMRPLAEYVHRCEPEWAIRTVQLAGHGGTLEELKRTNELDWMRDVRDGYDELRARCDRVLVAGLSLGAVLSCRLAVENREDGLAGLVLLAPVFDLPWPSNHLLWLYSLFADQRPKPENRAAYYQAHGLYSHMAYPVTGLKAVRRNGRIAWRALPEISAPTLIVAGRLDRLMSEGQVRKMVDRIGSGSDTPGSVEVVWAPASGHVVTVEPDADDLLRKCVAFMHACLARDAQANPIPVRP